MKGQIIPWFLCDVICVEYIILLRSCSGQMSGRPAATLCSGGRRRTQRCRLIRGCAAIYELVAESTGRCLLCVHWPVPACVFVCEGFLQIVAQVCWKALLYPCCSCFLESLCVNLSLLVVN